MGAPWEIGYKRKAKKSDKRHNAYMISRMMTDKITRIRRGRVDETARGIAVAMRVVPKGGLAIAATISVEGAVEIQQAKY